MRSTTAPAVPGAAPQTNQLREAAICAARRSLGWGPHRIGWALGIARSTVYAVLRRAAIHRLAWLHRATREIVRYEHGRPGALVHLDIKKLGRIPQGGGKRILPGFAETRSGPRHSPRLGFDFLHVAADDHSRSAYVEALAHERGATAAGFLQRALAHFERHGIAAERILTDNGACYVSRIFASTAASRGLRLKRTRPFRPQTNGKAEAFIKRIVAISDAPDSGRRRCEAMVGAPSCSAKRARAIKPALRSPPSPARTRRRPMPA